MSKKEQIDNLHMILETLQDIYSSLKNDVSDLSAIIEEKEFLPVSLMEKITDELSRSRSMQDSLITGLEELQVESFPAKIADFEKTIDRCKATEENAGRYMRALSFFMHIQSEDEAVQRLLEEKKASITSSRPEEMSPDDLKDLAEPYTWFHEYCTVEDEETRFSNMYRMISSFEEPLVKAAALNRLILPDEIPEFTPASSETDKESVQDDPSGDTVEKAVEPEPDEDHTSALEETLAATSDEELSAGNDTEGPEVQEEDWESIGIEDPTLYITPEDESIVSVEQSSKANKKFGLKEFKGDMAKQLLKEKVACFREAYLSGGYTLRSLKLMSNTPFLHYDDASFKLQQLGYVKKTNISGVGSFLSLSQRGKKALQSRDVLYHMGLTDVPPKKNFGPKTCAHDVFNEEDDSSNSALTRYFAFYSIELADRIFPDSSPMENSVSYGLNFFFTCFPNAANGRNVLFYSIFSEDYRVFASTYRSIGELSDMLELVVVPSLKKDTARTIAKWLLGSCGIEADVWYCGKDDTEFFDARTDEPVDLDAFREEAGYGETDEDDLETEAAHEEERGNDVPDPSANDGEKTAKKEDTRASSRESSRKPKKHEKPAENTPSEKKKETPKKGTAPAMEKGEEEQEEAASGSATAPESAAAVSYTSTASEDVRTVPYTNAVPEDVRKEHDEAYEKMLSAGRFYGATAYVKALSAQYPYYGAVYRQLSYALNDPMASCLYSSDTVFDIFYGNTDIVSDYYAAAAAARNYFYDQYSYDYSLQQLHAVLSGNHVLMEEPAVEGILYSLMTFKKDYHKGMDRYADYREKERTLWEKHFQETLREAREYYESYSTIISKENAGHKRFLETQRVLLGPESDLSEYLQYVVKDDRDMLGILADYLKLYFVKDNTEINVDNIDSAKMNAMINDGWNRAAQNIRLVKKSSVLTSSLRMNLYKRIYKVAACLCQYVSLLQSAIPNDGDPAFIEYRKRKPALKEALKQAISGIEASMSEEMPIKKRAGKMVLLDSLLDIQSRMDGVYSEGDNRYFYIGFLKNDKVLLDDSYMPVLEDVAELPDFSVTNRIIAHCNEPEMDFGLRLSSIVNGEDDYGSAKLILDYLKKHDLKPEGFNMEDFSMDEAIIFPQKDIKNKRSDFIEDLELAQFYGQIDNTVENSKEVMVQIMENWYEWANETMNYGFFSKILVHFREKVRHDAQIRAVELKKNLGVYIDRNPEWEADETVSGTVKQVNERIEQQNYAAAEDLLNRLQTGDLDSDIDGTMMQEDYLEDFFEEYDTHYRKTANSGLTLKSLAFEPKNKDEKGANRLLENWPRGTGFGEGMLRQLLFALGFNPGEIRRESPLQEKIESYLVQLKKPENGRRSNYKHPIFAFGSEAEEKGFRVVCLFGKTDAGRLIDTFKEIGNAQNTLVLVDYALTISDRRTLARRTKKELGSKCFSVIDRVAVMYLAKHYAETSVNRMLMAITMPFAYFQPYIDKSADVMPPEMFIGRKAELEKIESPTGVNIVYGGRQLGKTALLRMAKKDIDRDENGDRAIIVNALGKDYKKTARLISEALYDEKFLKTENITEDWSVLARDIKNRLRDKSSPIPYFLLMIDEADVFIESCGEVGYQPFNELKSIQSIGTGRFKFVVAGLRNIVRFKRAAALGNNSVLTHFDSLTVKPFRSMEARELLEGPLSYLGFRFPRDNETEILISTIFGTTNYFPGLLQTYCTKLIEAMQRDYAGYAESETPPYYVRKELIKKVLAEQSLQHDIREKFFITLKVGDDDYYYIIALLAAYHYHTEKSNNGCNASDLYTLADEYGISKLTQLGEEKIAALMEEMVELNVLQYTGDGRYRFTRHSFCQMMGNVQQIEDDLLNNYMGE